MIRVWLDDLRPMPPGYDIWVKTAKEAIDLLMTNTVCGISIDHDLGDEEKEDCGRGTQVTNYIGEAAYHGEIEFLVCQVHSANPVGRDNMIDTLRSAYCYWGVENSTPFIVDYKDEILCGFDPLIEAVEKV